MKNRVSLISILVCVVVVLSLDFSYKYYKSRDKIIESDAKHYYAYIPSVIIFHDISQKFLDTEFGPDKHYFWTGVKLDNGKNYIKTTMGVALLQSVIIIPMHYTFKALGFPADGFSEPYKLAILMSSLLYFALGLLIIRYLVIKNLKFSDTVAAITILAIGLGTNLLVYVSKEPSMSHAYSFFAIGMFVFCLDRYLKNRKWANALLTGISFGLVVLIRQVNVITVVLFLLWDVDSLKDLKDRILMYLLKPHFSGLIIIGFILIWIPQLMYYYSLVGSIFFNGYGKEASKFFFDNPQISKSLFSYQKGWFVYTPIMFLAVIGFLPLFFSQFKKYALSVFIIMLSLIYVNSSWYSWWFGGGFGQRAYIDIYVLMAIPLAGFINFTLQNKISRVLISLIFIVLISNGVFQTVQYFNNVIHFSGMTKEAFWYSIGRIEPGSRHWAFIEESDSKLAEQGIYKDQSCKKRTEEEWIQFYIGKFKDNPDMIKFLEDKAKSNNVPFEKQMYDDAKWVLKEDRKHSFTEWAVTKKSTKEQQATN